MAKLTKDSTLTWWRILILIIGGLMVGLISGIFGGGGGIIVIPLLTSIGLMEEREAHATSIAVILPIAIVCFVTYLMTGVRAEVDTSIFVTIGVLAGGIVGTTLLRRLRGTTLRIVFYLIMIVAGVRMLLPS